MKIRQPPNIPKQNPFRPKQTFWLYLKQLLALLWGILWVLLGFFPFCQKLSPKSLFWVEMVQFSHPRRSLWAPANTLHSFSEQHVSPPMDQTHWSNDLLQEGTNALVHLPHRLLSLPCASVTGPSPASKPWVLKET